MNIFEFIFKNHHFFRFVFGWKKNGRLFHLNLEEYIEYIEKHIAALKHMGVKKGDRVGICCNTRAEWHFFDMALLATGAIGVPIYPSFTQKELLGIHDICDLNFLIFESCSQLKDITPENLKQLSQIKFLIIEEGHITCDQEVFLYDDIMDQVRNEELPRLQDVCKEIQDDDICNYLLTSGTTSLPKVSVINHKNLYFLLDNIKHLMYGRLAPGSRSLIHLPLSHVLGRCDSLLHLVLPIENIIGESVNSLVSDLQLIKPTYFITVPRVITKIKEKILENVENSGGLIARTFHWATQLSQSFFRKVDNEQVPSNFEKQTFYLVQNKILKNVREQISPHLDFIVSGGAPLQSEDFDFFRCLGIPIIQGYGLTETLGPITFNFLGKSEKGSVGRPFRDVKIIIAEDGEILSQSPFCFQGYLLGDGTIDRSSFTEDGFFKTGDIGELLPSGNLKITDRKKDLIVTSYGKNVSPLKIEAMMTSSPYIDFFMTIGEQRNFITGLVGVSKDGFADIINDYPELSTAGPEEFAKNPEVAEIIKNEILRVNQELSDFEQVKKFRILPIDLRYEQDFITPSLKIKRNRIYNKFLPLVDAMYQ